MIVIGPYIDGNQLLLVVATLPLTTRTFETSHCQQLRKCVDTSTECYNAAESDIQQDRVLENTSVQVFLKLFLHFSLLMRL